MKKVIIVLMLVSLCAGAVGLWQSSHLNNPDQVTARIEQNLQHEIDVMEHEAQDIIKSGSVNTYAGQSDKRAYFIFQYGKLVGWSTNDYAPESQRLNGSDQLRYLRMGGSDFLMKEWTIGDKRTLVGLVLLIRQYKITNAYLQPEWNRAIFPVTQLRLHDPGMTGGVPVKFSDHELFRVDIVNYSDRYGAGFLAVGALGCFIICIVLLLVIGLKRLQSKNPDLTFVAFGVGLFIIRCAMIMMNFPTAFINLNLFDPQYFASSEWNPSLGDLFLNTIALFFLCLYLFRNYFRFYSIRWLIRSKMGSIILRVISACACFFGLLFPFIVVQTIYNNSAITLSIAETLSWDLLRIISFLIVLLSSVSAFLFVHVFTRLMLSGIRDSIKVAFYLLIGLLGFVVINELTGQSYRVVGIVAVCYLIVILRTRLYGSLAGQGYATFTYFTLAILCFAAEIGYGIRHFADKERSQSQIRFANNFLVDRDYLGEYLLNDSRQQIENDVFIQSRFASPFLGKEAVREKIRQVFLPAYLDRYLVNIKLFNSSGESLDEGNNATFSTLISSYDGLTSNTEYPGVFVVNRPGPGLTQKYVVVAKANRNGMIQGYVVMEFALKRYIPESVYPELLVDNRFQQIYQPQNFSFAILSGERILISYGDFDYEKLRPQLFQLIDQPGQNNFDAFGYHHVIVDEGTGNRAVVSSKLDAEILRFADYSFQFVLGIFVLLIMLSGEGIKALSNPRSLLLSSRIQLLLNLAFFIPLALVSVITITLVSAAFNEKMNEEYLNKSQDFAGQLSRLISAEDQPSGGTEDQLTNWSKLADVDANLYSSEGKLIASSQPLIFENQLQAPYLSPVALSTISSGEHNFIATENIGNLRYFVSYAALRSPTSGKLLGVLGIPFFQSGRSLERMQITVFSNIISIFSVVFIVLLAAFYVVSRWLTYPFRLITASLEKTSLTQTNQPLVWQANDEIGMMVRQYNEMLNKLQLSKAELERGQRERAWREIAQQVAHEIKNPLTPMKLKLQQLERTGRLSTEDPVVMQKAIEALLEQVEILNGIASSFSTFAKMPEPIMARVELAGILRRIADLHKSSGSITLIVDREPLYVMADEQLLSRILSNLVLNAEQAADAARPLSIEIRLQHVGQCCRITVLDNGTGMAPEIKRKVFLPQFSTKQSGSGLGLAIARQGIEQMGGSITFDSTFGIGTTFQIELPAME